MTPAADPPPNDDLVSDEDLVAYLDGELPPDDERTVEARLAADGATRARADELKRTYDLLDFLPKPEPSASFTTRTVTAVMPLMPGSASGSRFAPATARRRWSEVVAWVAVAVAAVALGGFAHRFIAPPPAEKRDDPPTADDYKLMARLPLYAGVDDLDFLRALEQADLFDVEPAGGVADHTAPPMTDDHRDALLAQFRTFPPARQQQLRALHQALADLPPAEREPLLRTLEGYAVWLGRLPATERRRVLDAPPAGRLDAVQSAHARQWRETLPKAKQAAIKDAAGEERAELVAIYRGQERGRRDEWELAARRWKQLGDKGNTPWPFDDPERVRQIDEYIQAAFGVNPARLPAWERERKNDLPPGCRLSREELLTLRSHREAATQEGYWLSYGAFLLRLSEQHPTLPRPKNGKPIVEPVQVPPAYNVPGPAKVKPAVGKWPDFALEVWRATPRADQKAPPLGPCRPEEFTEPVRQFIQKTLADADRKRLEPALGRWPQYPQRLLELARGQNLSVPEVMLPGEPRRWQEMYQLSGKK